MKERPIIFNGEMVRAILDRRKTQTRRIIKGIAIGPGDWPSFVSGPHRGNMVKPKYCPYGIPGDRLWVRETWRIASLPFDEHPCIQYKANIERAWCDPFEPDYDWDMKYESWFEYMTEQLMEDCDKAGLEPDRLGEMVYKWDWDTIPTRWQPSIFIPRWASRITLEVTGVRVERVQQITTADTRREGVNVEQYMQDTHTSGEPFTHPFAALWDSLNAKRSYSWDSNPWIWVVEFSVIEEE